VLARSAFRAIRCSFKATAGPWSGLSLGEHLVPRQALELGEIERAAQRLEVGRDVLLRGRQPYQYLVDAGAQAEEVLRVAQAQEDCGGVELVGARVGDPDHRVAGVGRRAIDRLSEHHQLAARLHLELVGQRAANHELSGRLCRDVAPAHDGARAAAARLALGLDAHHHHRRRLRLGARQAVAEHPLREPGVG
jgi:hypothetical protein